MDALIRTVLGEEPLSAAHERRLACAARNGDTQARSELVRGSLRLVALRVLALGGRGTDADDAFQAGALGLLAAVARFDPDRGARLGTFAWPWITAGVRSALARPLGEQPVDDLPEPPPTPLDRTLERVEALLAPLDREERRVLEVRHGLDGTAGGRTWEQVATVLGTSPSSARRTGERAMSRLRRGVGTVGDRAPHAGADPP